MEKKKKLVWVPVVAGLLLKDSKVLVGRRPDNKNLGGKWEFPGGKIESTESPEEALYRELREELDIEVSSSQLIYTNTHNYGETSFILIFYKILFWKGLPKTNYHSELKWVNVEELKSLSLPEANEKLLPQIILSLKSE